jgi:hypothetical protein
MWVEYAYNNTVYVALPSHDLPAETAYRGDPETYFDKQKLFKWKMFNNSVDYTDFDPDWWRVTQRSTFANRTASLVSVLR